MFLLLIVLSFAAFGVYYYYNIYLEDRASPKITVPDEVLTVSVNAEDKDILSGISAWDETDGDVSDSLLIEAYGTIMEDHTVSVSVAAFDSAGNVSKAKRLIKYSDYESPKFTLSGPLYFQDRSGSDIFSFIGAEDIIDGDITNKVKASLVRGRSNLSSAGEYLVEFRVTNSLGDTSYLSVPVEIYNNVYNMRVDLNNYLVYLKKGESFDLYKNINKIIYDSRIYSLYFIPNDCTVTIESDLNTMVEGVYAITYYMDTEFYHGSSRLIVVVEK